MTYRNDSVVALANEMVFVRVNAEKDTVTARKYGPAGFPTIVLAKADGTEIDRIYGYAEPQEFVTTIRDYMADRNTLGDYLRRAEATPTPALLYQVAEKYAARKKYTEAETYYQRIISADPKNEQGYTDTTMMAFGEMQSRAKQYDAAKATFKKLLESFPNSELADDALYNMAVTSRRAEKYDEAINGFKMFMTVYPNSELVPDAEIYIAFSHAKKGDTAEAIRLYQKFLVDRPTSPDSSWVADQIKTLQSPPADQKGK